jgi:hypothetical protein
LANCPVLWKNKLQTEIALSTMEEEYVALSTSCSDLCPLIDIAKELYSLGPPLAGEYQHAYQNPRR